MINKTTKDILNEIVSVIRDPFANKSFELKKQRFFEHVADNGNIFSYEIIISKRKGYFSLHIRLLLKNNILMSKVNSILERVVNDPSYEYPDNWDEKTIKESKKTILSNDTVTMLTDWRRLKSEDESLDEFNSRFSVWIRVFDDLSEIDNWKNQLIDSVNLSVSWFSKVESKEWIISNTVYPALYLLKKENRMEELECKYSEVLSKARLKDELILFMKYLRDI